LFIFDVFHRDDERHHARVGVRMRLFGEHRLTPLLKRTLDIGDRDGT